MLKPAPFLKATGAPAPRVSATAAAATCCCCGLRIEGMDGSILFALEGGEGEGEVPSAGAAAGEPPKFNPRFQSGNGMEMRSRADHLPASTALSSSTNERVM